MSKMTVKPLLFSIVILCGFADFGRACPPEFYRDLLPHLVAGGMPFKALKPAAHLPLSDTLLAQIEGHPIGTLAEVLDQGAGLTFLFRYGEAGHFRNNHTLGEQIQSLFLQRIIRHLFPQSKIAVRGENEYIKARQGAIELYLNDSFEVFKISGPSYEMIDFKFANSTLANINRAQLRRDFRIPPEMLVHSYYLQRTEIVAHTSFGPKHEQRAPSLQAMIESLDRKPQIIFYSESGIRLPSGISLFRDAEMMGYRGHWLSKTTVGSLDLTKKHFIANDMASRLPYIHALADVAIVYGPINFMEPLFVGTPTVFFSSPIATGTYKRKGFGQMKRTALKTGGGHAVKDLTEFASLLNSKKLRGPQKLPSDVKQNKKRALTRILDQLYEQIRNETRLEL